jgi:hypothetical protein
MKTGPSVLEPCSENFRHVLQCYPSVGGLTVRELDVTTLKTYCGAELQRRKDHMRQENAARESPAF